MEALLGAHAYALEDRQGSMGIDAAMHAEAGWRPAPAGMTNFGFTTASWWLRVSLCNTGDVPEARLLEVGSALQDYVDVYLIRDGSRVA